jgi:hypothetical protein
MRTAIRTALVVAALAVPALGWGKVLNVEFKFTPYTGDTKNDHVQSVAGTATVYVNGIFVASQPIQSEELPVMFDEREIAPSVWLPTESLGAVLRPGKNTVRIEFEPKAATPYKAQLRWAQVTDQVTEDERPDGGRATNQANEGVENKDAKGKIVLTKEFQADFAKKQPWHDYPAVTSLTDDDKQKILALVAERAGWFKPDFAGVYAALGSQENVDLARLKKEKCLDKAYDVGVRIGAPTADMVEIATTDSAAVSVRGKGEHLYVLDPSQFEKVKDEDVQMCAGMALAMVYQPRLIVVRAPDGTWKAVP